MSGQAKHHEPMAGGGTLAGRLSGWAARHAVLVVLLVTVLSIGAGVLSVRGLRINTDNFDMISAEAPFRKANIAYRQAFPSFGDQLAVVIDAATPEEAERAAARLVGFMQSQPDLFSHVRVPGGEEFFRRNGLLYLDVDTLQGFVDRLAAAQGLLTVLAEQPDLTGLLDMLRLSVEQAEAVGDGESAAQLVALVDTVTAMAMQQGQPTEAGQGLLSWRRTLAVDGQRGLSGRSIVLTKPVQDFSSLSPAKRAIAVLRTAFPDLQDPSAGPVRFRITGDAALDTEELASVRLGGTTAGALSGVGILLLLLIGLRRVRAVLATLAVLVSGLVLSLGFATLAIGQLNLLSVAFVVLFIGLAVDFSIHFALRVREAGGLGPAVMRLTGDSVGGSLILGALAAAIGFLSFLPTEYRGLAELGVIAGGSMVIAVALNLTLMPALLSVGHRNDAAPDAVTMDEPSGESADPSDPGRSAPSLIRRVYRPVLVVGLAAGLVGAVLTPTAHFDFNPINLKDRSTESVATFLDLAAAPDGGAYAVDGLAPDLDVLRSTAEALRALPETGRVLTLESFVPKDQPAKLAILENASLFLFSMLMAVPGPEPDDAARAAAVASFASAVAAAKADASAGNPTLLSAMDRLQQALTVLAPDELARLEYRVTALLPDWLRDIRLAFSATPVTVDDIPDDIRDQWIGAGGVYRFQAFPAEPVTDNVSMARFAAAVQSVTPHVTGTPVVVTAAGAAVLNSFRIATLVAAIGIVALIVLTMRRATDVVLTAAPLALASVLTLGLSSLLGEDLNFANVIVLPLLFGLGVASSIHVVQRWRHSGSVSVLMGSSTPMAVLFSVLTTLASFGGLALSPHLGMASMGRLLTIAILATLFATLVFLPALLQWVEVRGRLATDRGSPMP